MDDLAAWLTQIFDEDEARVRAAIDDDGGQVGGFEDDFDRLTGHGPLGVLPRFGEAAARMIVWQTPRRALARIAADRQILADWQQANGEHQSWCEEYDDFGAIEDYGRADKVRGALESLERIVRLLAQPHADRPGYQETWRLS